MLVYYDYPCLSKKRNAFMSESKSDGVDVASERYRALSRWDGEGGAGPCGPQLGGMSERLQSEAPPLKEFELVHLLVRVIALENLVIALLAHASEKQLDLVREMATYISPRPGHTEHPLTIQAAAHLIQFVERAGHFRDVTPG